MKNVIPINSIKYHVLIVGVVFLILKLFKAVTFSWMVTLLPFLIMIFIESVFFVWGYIIYRKSRSKHGE